MHRCLLKAVLVLIVATSAIYASDAEDPEDALTVFIDCEWCDLDHIRTEIPFVKYAVYRTAADVFVLVTTLPTAGEGAEHTIVFMGQNNYEGMSDTLKYFSMKFDTEEIIYGHLVNKLKLGLMRFIARTPSAEEIEISYTEITPPAITVDKWRNWMFSINIGFDLEGEEFKSDNSIYCAFTANRITEDWKIETSLYYDYEKEVFELDDTTTISSSSEEYGSDAAIVRSLDDHWSAGGDLTIYSSTYSNRKAAFMVAPAIEYNIFPYSQATSKELRVHYRAGYAYSKYYEETIYDKTEESFLFQGASVTLYSRQRWGTASTSVYGAHQLDDFSTNLFGVSGMLSLPIAEQLSFDLAGYFSVVNNIISTPKRDLTEEEILLDLQQLSTEYEYGLGVGFTFSFGSLYSNVVNPRFGT